jgi:hypothetical protein
VVRVTGGRVRAQFRPPRRKKTGRLLVVKEYLVPWASRCHLAGVVDKARAAAQRSVVA